MSFLVLLVLYPKSDKVPAHWSRWTVGPVVYVSTLSVWAQWQNTQLANQGRPRDARAPHGSSPCESAPHKGGRLCELTMPQACIELDQCELTSSSPSTSSIDANSPQARLARARPTQARPASSLPLNMHSIVLITSAVARRYHLSARPRA